MIRKITLENFFSFNKKTEIPLNSGINVLVGINGSGKSNFIKAIELLYESTVGEGFEKLFLKKWGGFDIVANYCNTQSDFIRIMYEFDGKAISKSLDNEGYTFYNNLTFEITIHRTAGTSYYLEEKIYSENEDVNKRPFIYLEMKNGKGVISTRNEDKGVSLEYYKPQDSEEVFFKTQEMVLRQISDPVRYYPLYTLKRAIEDFSVYGYFDTTGKSKIRQPGTFGTEEKLLPDGSNLAQILNYLKNRHTLDYNKIQQLIRKINPHFEDTSFDFLSSSLLYLVLREEKLSRAVGALHISDGTLRFLLLLTIFYNINGGNLICIDEPETGLHPDMTNTIAQAVRNAQHNNKQVIVATHSPLFLNSFELDEILIFEKDEQNSSIVSKKSEEDFSAWNDDYLTGQLWLRGELGGKRW